MLNLIDHYANGEKLYQKILEKVYKKYNLTYMELNILIFLFNNKQYDTASEIVKYRHLTKSHVSTAINALVKKDLIKTFYKEDNRKSIHLRLTSKADPILKDGIDAQNEFKKLTTSSFSKAEIDTLLNLISRIDKNIKENLDK